MINPINGWKWNVEELQRQLQGIDTSKVTASYSGSTELIQDVLDSLDNRINNLQVTTEVGWTSLTANGVDGEETTTILTATFDVDPTTLGLSNYSLTGASLVSVSGTGLTRTIEITNISVANGENVTLTLTNPSGYNITPMQRSVPVVVVPVNDIYEPEWIDQFNIPEQDANGNTILANLVAPTARVMYVSADGNDETAQIYSVDDFDDIFHPVDEMAFATTVAAYANVRADQGDIVLFRRGDTFTNDTTIEVKSGISPEQRSIIAAYGDGPKPIINRRDTGGGFTCGRYTETTRRDTNYVAIKDLDFRYPQRDPDSPEFVGWDNITFSGSFVNMTRTWKSCKSILIEGCDVSHTSTAIGTGGTVDNNNEITDIIIRRNKIRNTYKQKGEGITHPQGMAFVAFSQVLVEENVLDSCGFYKTSDPDGEWAKATQYCHAIYSMSVKKSVFRNNISYNPSSIHFKFTSNVELAITETIDGVVSQIEYEARTFDNWSGAPKSGVITFKPNGAIPEFDLEYIDLDVDNRIITLSEPFDFSATPLIFSDTGGTNARMAINYPKSTEVSVYGNVFVDGEVGVSFGGNENTTDSDAAPRFSDFRVQNNILYKIGESRNTNRTLAYGLEAVDNTNAVITDNIIIGSDNPAVPEDYAIKVFGFSSNSLIENNQSINRGGAISNAIMGDGDEIYSNAVYLDPSVYVDPTRTLEKYSESHGYDESLLGFKEGINEIDFNSNTFKPKDIIDYFKYGFSFVEPVILSQPTDKTITDQEATSFYFDLIGNTQYTFQWYLNDEILVGETSRKLVIESPENGQTVYCKAIDINGYEEIVSRTASIQILGQRYYAQLKSGDTITYTANEWEAFRFKLKYIDGGFRVFSDENATGSGGLYTTSSGPDAGKLHIRRGAVKALFDLSVNDLLTDGNTHQVELRHLPNLSEEPAKITIDDVVYETTNIPNFTGFGFPWNGIRAAGTIEIWDLEIINNETGEVIRKFNMDANDTTEEAVIGTGTMNYNLINGEWVFK